jgi:hypothetical protein
VLYRPGMPDFSWHTVPKAGENIPKVGENIPKVGENTPNCHLITKWP